MTTELMAQGIAYIEENGQILFSAEEIGKQLGYSNPKQSIANLFNRNYQELLAYSVEIKSVSTDGKAYNKRHFTEEGVYILSMLAATDKARDFRSRVAKLLKELREKEIHKAYDEGVKVGQNALSLEAKNMVYKQARERLMRDIDKIEDRAFDEGIKYQKRRDGLASLMKAIDYLSRGVNLKDTAAMLECTPDTIRRRLKRLGLWEQVKKDNMRFSKNNTVQGSLI